MLSENSIIKKIVGIECPTDKVIDRVVGVLEEYDLEGQYQITSRVDEDYEETRLKYYRAYSDKGDRPDLVMIVKDGMDGYVAKVIDAYTEEEK